MFSTIKKHLPYIIGVVWVVLNALVANGDINLSNHAMDIINSVLPAFGLGVLHKRQQQP